MTRFDARLRRLEQDHSASCPGEYRIEVYHVRPGSEANLPPPNNRCLRCGQVHPPADDGREQPIRRVVFSYPTAGSESDSLGEQGWRESDFRLDREGRREDV
jgi:hypothetical protein